MGLNCASVLHVWRYATVDNCVPSSGVVHALWARRYWMISDACLRHVALTTGVDGEIRLIVVSSRLANAKPLSSSVLVFVDDVRDWTVVARGIPLPFRTVCQSSALPRTLKVLGAAGVSFPLLDNKQLPRPSWPKVQFSPDSSFPRFQPNFPCLLYTSPSPRDLSTSRMPSSA